MPLSEREQQILDEMEADLRGDVTASSTSTSSRPRERLAGLKVGVLLVLVGVVMLVGFFASSNIFIGVAAFAVMVLGIVLGASSLRTEMTRGGNLSDRVTGMVAGWERSLRSRYRNED